MEDPYFGNTHMDEVAGHAQAKTLHLLLRTVWNWTAANFTTSLAGLCPGLAPKAL